ncbi:hypothetical protein LTR78_002984 [Recurvomyces mirabilis]|uniref:Swiss Army Knife RNA repair protein HAD domain-containing protein n=1 Tax=Recurvomyces mirabilis TaxID=574656 RepID=A0AAE0WSV4_9PEZI|nr:hypothetical protein LTR78_002984 [Recurvomyces mirabilis]
MNGSTPPVRTITALKRWSCVDKQMPGVEGVRNIHVYDFDNTLFSSPLPNRQLWNSGTCGSLQAQDFLHNGGWWHNPAILSATGQGLEVEEGRAWQGFWNEKIVELCALSAAEEDTLSIMLTGRAEANFSDLLNRMITAKGLYFDMICLKPSVSPSGELFASTLTYKQALLRDIVYTYPHAAEIRIYEDRPKHTKAFRDFFAHFNRSLSSPSIPPPVQRAPIRCEVIQVSEQETTMDPTTETACVQAMINTHNTSILNQTAPPRAVPYKLKRTVFFTGYLLTPPDTERIKSLVKLPPSLPEHEVKWLANNILITPRPAPKSLLDKVGGLGAKVRWRVTGLGNWNQRVWAARVAPVDPGVRVHSENATPCVVLALKRDAKPIEATKISSWQAVSQSEGMEFETTMGEKVMLRIEEEVRGEDAYEASFASQGNGRQQQMGGQGRKHPRDEEFPALGSGGQQGRVGIIMVMRIGIRIPLGRGRREAGMGLVSLLNAAVAVAVVGEAGVMQY